MTKAEKFLLVTDSSCTLDYPERTHTINVRGQDIAVTFNFGKETVLPFEQGVKFSKLAGFTVEEKDGYSLVIPAVTPENIKQALAKDEVIAKLGELSLSSLKLRAASLKGGEIFLDAGDDARNDIIAFIVGEPPVGLVAEPTVDGEEVLIEDEDETIIEGSEPNTNPETSAPQTVDGEVESGSGSETEADTEKTFTLDEVKGATDEALALAAEHGIDTTTLVGSGENGNVLKGDVEDYIKENNIQPAE